MYTFPDYIWEVLGERVPIRIRSTYRQDGDFLLVYNLGTLGRTMIALNHTATKIYMMCDGQHTIRQIIESIHKDYPDASLKQIIEDTHQCIRHMEFKRLVSVLREQFVKNSPNNINNPIVSRGVR